MQEENNLDYWVEDGVYGPSVYWEYNEEDKSELKSQAFVALDKYLGKLQVLVYDSSTDEPAVIVRYNDKMEVVEVQVFKEEGCQILSRWQESPWQKERDGE